MEAFEVNVINGYQLLAPFDSQNAGFSRWTFGRRNGQEYFLKEFQDVVYPDETTLSNSMRQNRIQECLQFEDQKVRLYHKINQVSDGNLVRICELFRCESHYYLATRRINGEKVFPAEIACLPLQDRLLICRSAAHALMRLHSAGIVHADIKQSNVLLQKTVNGKLTAKLIDFDASFFQDSPPEDEEELHFDQTYLTPEGFRFVCGEPVELTCKMDVFAMGLLMHEYLAGEIPGFDQDYALAYEAVLDGKELELSPQLPAEIRRILAKMLLCDPEERCSMAEVYRDLGAFFKVEEEKVPEKKPEVKPEKPDPYQPAQGGMGQHFRVVNDL